jgi:hypothetical protein
MVTQPIAMRNPSAVAPPKSEPGSAISRVETSRRRIGLIVTIIIALLSVVISGCGLSSRPPTGVTSQPTAASAPAQQAPDSPAPQPSGMPVCGDLTEIGGDLAALQNGPMGNAPEELQALGVQLSQVVAGTSRQSSDLEILIQDFNTEVTDTSDGTTLGTSQDPNAAVAGDSRMDDDFNALMSDCAGS